MDVAVLVTPHLYRLQSPLRQTVVCDFFIINFRNIPAAVKVKENRLVNVDFKTFKA